MADGTVRGAFELDAAQPLTDLRSIRDIGGEADTALASLGNRMDSLGGPSSSAKLDSYKQSLKGVADEAEDSSARIVAAWDAQSKGIDAQATKIEARIDDLKLKMDEYGEKKVSAEISLGGFDKVNAQLQEIEDRLDSIGRRSATARVSVAGGAGGAGGGSPVGTLARDAGSAGGGGFHLPESWVAKIALGALAAAPGIVGLAGSATALAGSATSATLGAGVVGLGAYGTLGAGGLLSAATIVPAIKNLATLTQAQVKYNAAVAEYGRRSSEAATAAKTLNAALSNATPAEAGAARQYGLLSSDWTRDTRGARNSVYQGASRVIYNARRAAPAVGRDANMAASSTSAAAVSFSQYLTDPQSLSILGSLTASFAANMPIAERSLQNVATTFGHLAVDAEPFFTDADRWVENWTAGLAKSSSDTQKVQGDMGRMVDSAKDWAGLAGATYRTIRDIFSAGTPSGDSMVLDLTDTLDRWDAWIQANPQKVTSFFTQAATTTDHIASTISSLLGDVTRLANDLDPIFNRALQLIQFASGVGGGNGILGGGLLVGGFEAGKSLLGSATGRDLSGVSSGRAAATFVTGRSGFMRRGASAAGGDTVAAAAATGGGGRTAGRASNYEVATGRTSGGAFLMGGVTEGPQSVLERRAAAAAEEDGGRFAGIRSRISGVIEDSPGLARAADMASSGRDAIMDAGGAAGHVLLPMVAIQALLGAVTSHGGAAARAGGAVNMATFGIVPSNIFSRALGTTNVAGGSPRMLQANVAKLSAQADAVRTPGQLRAVQQGVSMTKLYDTSEVGDQLSSTQQRGLQAALTQISVTAAKNAGAQASDTWQASFSTAVQRGRDPEKAVDMMLGTMNEQLKSLGPKGSVAFAESTAQWAKQMETENPKLRAPLTKLMTGIVGDLNKLQGTTGDTFSEIQRKVGLYNGQIYTSTKSEWAAISANLTNPMQVAQEKLAGSFATIKQEAISSLTSMGFTRSQAAQIVTATTQGGAGGQIAKGLATSGPVGGLTSTLSSAATAANSYRATGGMIGGAGLLDTVGMPDGSIAAPGEAWIANRHTMNDLSSATLAHYGKTAWQMIRDETRTHSSPHRHATGGSVSSTGSHYERLLAAANHVSSANFPYQWGGGHEQPARFGPFDCSGTVSYVVQQAGYNVPTTTAADIGSWGFPAGPGTATIYYSPVHTFMKINGAGPKGIGYFGTSGFARPGGGAGWFDQSPGDAYLAGFRTVHLPGLGSSGGMAGGAGGGQVNLRAPAMNGLGGVPLALGQRGSDLFAAGLSRKLNANSRVAGMEGGGDALNDVSGGSASSMAAERIGRRMMLADGWGAGQWPYLQKLWTRESGWNDNAVNPSSGAYGIPQALGHGHPYAMGDAGPQIAWGLNYIKGRYGSPAAAWAHEESAGWYQRGGGPIKWGGWHARGMDGITNGPTLFGAGERGRERVTVTPVTRGGSGNTTKQITVDMRGSRFYGTGRGDAQDLAEDVAGKILDALNRVGQGASDAQLIGADA